MVSIKNFHFLIVSYLIGAISNNLAKFSISFLESLGLSTHTIMLWWGGGDWGGGGGDELDRGTRQDLLVDHTQEGKNRIKEKGKYF